MKLLNGKISKTYFYTQNDVLIKGRGDGNE